MGLLNFLKKNPGPKPQIPLKKKLLFPLVAFACVFTALGMTTYFFLELRDLNRELETDSQMTLDLTALAAIDALILEDRQELSKILDRIQKSNGDFEMVAIENEDGKVLASWKSGKTLHDSEVHSFSKKVTIAGQTFGTITLKVSSQGVRRHWIGHALGKGILFPLVLTLFFLSAAAFLKAKLIKPIQALATYATATVIPADPPEVGVSVELNAISKALAQPKADATEEAPLDIAAELAAIPDAPAQAVESAPAPETAAVETPVPDESPPPTQVTEPAVAEAPTAAAIAAPAPADEAAVPQASQDQPPESESPLPQADAAPVQEIESAPAPEATAVETPVPAENPPSAQAAEPVVAAVDAQAAEKTPEAPAASATPPEPETAPAPQEAPQAPT